MGASTAETANKEPTAAQQASTGGNPNISEAENYAEEEVVGPTNDTAGQSAPQPISEPVNAPQDPTSGTNADSA